MLTTCVIIATCAVTGTIEDILSRYFFLICFFIFFNIKHVGVSSIIGFNNKKKTKNTRAYRVDFSRILRDDSQVIAVMMVVNGGGVEVDGDLDNRACITDRQEARKERKNLKPLKKIMVNNLKKNPSMCIFLSSLNHVLRAVRTEQCATADRR